jgi:hypothetical protein
MSNMEEKITLCIQGLFRKREYIRDKWSKKLNKVTKHADTYLGAFLQSPLNRYLSEFPGSTQLPRQEV